MYKSIGSHFQDNRTFIAICSETKNRSNIKIPQSTMEGASGFHPQSLKNVTCLLGLGDGPHSCTKGTTRNDTRHDIGFTKHRL